WGLPVMTVAMKPVTAPPSIVPSTPRVRTPDRSVTSSPSAASASGVPARIAPARTAMTVARPAMGLHRAAGAKEPDAGADEHVRSEYEEQQQALEHAGHRRRQVEPDLQCLAAQVQQRHEQAGEQDAERMQPAEKGNDDGGEAVPRRDQRLQLA